MMREKVPLVPRQNLEWKIITQCNYNCWYCLDRGDRVTPPPDKNDISRYSNAILSNLKEPWIIQITGGEPFINPEFIIGLTRNLVSAGHWIKIFSNLSADLSVYREFINITGSQLYKLKASFHPSETNFDEFLKKSLAINELISNRSKYKIFCVITPGIGNINRLKKYTDTFKQYGLNHDVIHMIDPTTKEFYDYSKEEKALIQTYFGDCSNELSMISHGHDCRSGYSYFAITQDFDAWSCWDAKFNNDRANYYGNLLKNFKFPYRRQMCPYKLCNYPNGIEEK